MNSKPMRTMSDKMVPVAGLVAFARKLGLASLVVGVLAATLPVAAASPQICHSPFYGGDYYCEYPVLVYTFPRTGILPNVTQQVFVIGTDYSVWTRWHTNGKLSDWVSLGGKIRHDYHQGDFALHVCRDNPFVVVVGLDNLPWYRYRQSNGVWTRWAHYYGVMC
jgi:hypothetical protein